MLTPPCIGERLVLPRAPGAASRRMTVVSAAAHFVMLALLVRVAVPVPATPPDAPFIPVLFALPAADNAPTRLAPARALAPGVVISAPPLMAPKSVTLAAPSASGRAISVPTTMSRPRRFQSQGLAVATPAVPRAVGLPGAPSAAAALPASDDGVLLGQFTSEIHAMVQAAAAMPAVARRQHREGRAQVRFSYLDGAVDGVTVTQSTMFRPLDDAALAAVRQARYPAPPARLRGRRLSLVIWIDFRLQAPTEG